MLLFRHPWLPLDSKPWGKVCCPGRWVSWPTPLGAMLQETGAFRSKAASSCCFPHPVCHPAISVPGSELCPAPHLPVHRGSDLLVCCELQGVHHSQDLIKISPSGGWVQDGELQLLIRAKNEHLSTGTVSGAGHICLTPLLDLLSPDAPSFPGSCLVTGVGTGEMPWRGSRE